MDFIEGLSPAVSIDQKSTSRNPRSTVGTITEVYDYLRLLYARAGRPHCPICGEPISRQSPQQIVDRLMAMPEGTRFQVLAPVVRGRKGEYVEVFRELATEGFSRARVDGQVVQLTDPPVLDKKYKHSIDIIVDRLAVKPNVKLRLTDSVETALRLAQGVVTIDFVDLDPKDPQRERAYSEKMACPNNHDIGIDELEPRQFSFNGHGVPAQPVPVWERMEVDPELVVPDDEKSLVEGAIAPWSSQHVADYFSRLIDSLAESAGFSMTMPWRRLPPAQKMLSRGRRAWVHVRYKNRYGRERSYNAKYKKAHPVYRAATCGSGERHVAGAVRVVHAGSAVPGVQGRSAGSRTSLAIAGPAMQSVCMDARDFEFPAEPLVVYLFNPFPEPVFVAVMEKLRRSIEESLRPIFVAYRYLEFEKLLAESSWLKRIAKSEQWAVYAIQGITHS